MTTKKKRIILSDDEEVNDSAPTNLTPSSKLAATLSGLEMSSVNKNMIKPVTKLPCTNDYDSFASDNELDHELTRRVMDGDDDSESEVEDRYFHIVDHSNSSKKDNSIGSRRSSRSSSANAKQKLKEYYYEDDDGFINTAGEHNDSDVVLQQSESDEEFAINRTYRGNKTPASSSSRGHRSQSSPSSSRTTPNTSSSILKSSRTSERCKAVSGRQNAQRDAALEDLRRKSQSGLSGVLQSSDDEGDNQISDGDADSSDEVRYVGSSSFSAPRKAPRQSSSSAASLTSWAKSQAAARSAVLRKDEREDDEDGAGDSVDDFIVGSDEEREEEEQRQAEALQRKEERRKLKVSAKRASQSGSSRSNTRADTPHRPSGDDRNRKRSVDHSEMSSGRKSRRIAEDDDDEEEEVQVVRSGSKRSNRSHLRVNDDDEEEEESPQFNGEEEEEEDGDADDESDDDEDEEEDEEEEEVDEHMMYLRMNAQRDEESEDDRMGAVLPMRKSFHRPEALRLYIEMLALSLVDSSFMQQMALATHSSSSKFAHYNDYVSAARQVENLICTNRESLLGSSAWRPEFLNQLCCRPFYSVSHVGAHSCGEKCEACGRTSQKPDFQVYLFGTTYDARKVWNSSRWDSLLPEAMFLYNSTSSSTSHKRAVEQYNVSSSGKKNKQFMQFSRLQQQDGAGDKGVRRTAAAALSHTLGEDVAKHILSGQQRKRRMIELSDDDEDDGNNRREVEREKRAADQENKRQRHLESYEPVDNKLNRKSECINLCDDDEEDAVEEVVESEEQRQQAEESFVDDQTKWWLKKWPRSLTKEAESKWQLAQHCKNRTQLYHTLLHYKFRLLLKIRERLESDCQKQHSAHYSGDLTHLARGLASDQRFVGVEVARFENLLRHAGSKWGGKEEAVHKDIWSDGDDKGPTRQLQLTTKRTLSLEGWLGTSKM